MRLIDADKLYPDRMTTKGGIAISQSQIADAPDVSSEYMRKDVVEKKLTKLIDEMEEIFADIRERLVDDSVCGLCEYDCDHGISGFANECPGFDMDDCFKLSDEVRKKWMEVRDESVESI